jgi:hypothetical protein
LETFTAPRELVSNHHFKNKKQKSLEGLTDDMIDAPIVDVIHDFNKRDDCFTLQCCYGHFLYEGQDNPENLESIPETNSIKKVEYRIAYLAFCIDNCMSGRLFMKSLQDLTLLDPENIQFGSADWFWRQQVNSYALQVEPDRFKNQDRALIDYQEALYLEKLKNKFYLQLKGLIY